MTTPKQNSSTGATSSSGLTPEVSILAEIHDEVLRQNHLWGEQNHPDGTALIEDGDRATRVKNLNDFYVEEGSLTWRDILLEEVYEAFAEEDPDRLREELVQVAAVATNWVRAIDRRRT